MIKFIAEVERFGEKGEKTRWFYIAISSDNASLLKPGCKKSFRVKGKLDALEINGLALTPIGEGDFILALKKELRQALKKQEGAVLQVELEEDVDFKIELPEDLHLCLSDESGFLERFMSLPMSHRNWYINWLNSAKTEPTRTKRLVNITSAMERHMSFGQMIREGKGNKESL
jgi:uncharacterized protein YdeI (YjbR/CyaY-like superfamily)